MLPSSIIKVNIVLIYPDSDVALHKFGYYEQGKNETSGGFSIFSDASDDIRAGFTRQIGVSKLKTNCDLALMNMVIPSTGTKLSAMLHHFYDNKEQDGVFGRVSSTWCPSINELHEGKAKDLANVS